MVMKKLHTLQVKLLRATERKKDVIRVTKKRSPPKITAEPSKPNKLRTAMIKFLEREDHTKICPGKKDCVTKNNIKRDISLTLC